MNPQELQVRTKRFAVDVINFSEGLPRKRANDILARQLISSASSVGVNNREACRAESRHDFVHKVGIAAKEAAETEYWLELINETNPRLEPGDDLLREANEILRILVASGRTAKQRSTR